MRQVENEKMWEKEKMLLPSIFFFFSQCFQKGNYKSEFFGKGQGSLNLDYKVL